MYRSLDEASQHGLNCLKRQLWQVYRKGWARVLQRQLYCNIGLIYNTKNACITGENRALTISQLLGANERAKTIFQGNFIAYK